MKALIIEDEELIANVLLKKIKKVAPDITVMEILPSLKTARRWFSQNAEPDLLFMDIQLSDGVSFDIFKDFDLNCPVIFTTAYDEYAIRAFKVNGIDYLLKPINDHDLTVAIDKCRKQLDKVEPIAADINSLIQSLSNPNAAAKQRKIYSQCTQSVDAYQCQRRRLLLQRLSKFCVHDKWGKIRGRLRNPRRNRRVIKPKTILPSKSTVYH